MASASGEPTIVYAVPWGWRRARSTACEPGPVERPYRLPPGSAAGPPAGATPPRPAPRPAAGRVRLHLKPGQKGTKRLVAEYGDRLICVRYRYDARRKKRLKTVELLVAEADWDPPRARVTPDRIVALRVAFADMAVRDQVKQAGGRWDAQRRVWHLRYDRVLALGLAARVVAEPASSIRGPGPTDDHLHRDA